ncbi:unnamed protein product [Thlaspi arvense]|uniref:Plastocyanin-like domain-containing protein n=1 Tax=Thlaspi arvense TaxID=13288 RepID=A0AAU9SGI0_THLAR|nr:unnamed protein product [Thlaspi arvense]
MYMHGVKQPRNPWSDGPDFITQCQISPGTNHTYKVIFSTEEGTLWWHAHSDWTQSTVHGAIHILPAEGTTYPFPEPDGEHDIILELWFSSLQYPSSSTRMGCHSCFHLQMPDNIFDEMLNRTSALDITVGKPKH